MALGAKRNFEEIHRRRKSRRYCALQLQPDFVVFVMSLSGLLLFSAPSTVLRDSMSVRLHKASSRPPTDFSTNL
jgi:hypothetical protein